MRISFYSSSSNSTAFFTFMFQHGGLGAEKGRKKKGESGDKGQNWRNSPSSRASSQLGPLLAMMGHWRREEEDEGGERRRKGKNEIERRGKIWKEKKRNVEGIRKNAQHLDAKLISKALEV